MATVLDVRRPAEPGTTRSTADVPAVVLLVSIVVVRFFTENLQILPRYAQLIDVFAVVPLTALVITRPARTRRSWTDATGFARPVYFVLLIASGSALVNAPRVAAMPAGLFVVGLVAPALVFMLMWQLRPHAGTAAVIARTFFALGAVQVVIGIVHDMPDLVATGNPDRVSGTFGHNAYQYTTFLSMWLFFVLARRRIRQPAGKAENTAFFTVKVLAVLTLVFAAQYRAMLVFLPLALFACLLMAPGERAGRMRLAMLTGLLTAAAVMLVAAQFPHLKLVQTLTLAKDPAPLVESGKVAAFANLGDLFLERPGSMALGTGPGTYSSRGYRTFAQRFKGQESDVAGEYVQRVNRGSVYETDVAERYVKSIPFVPIQGGTQLSTPYTSFVSVPAELGLIGAFIVALIYTRAIRIALSGVRTGWARRDEDLFSLGFAAFGGLILVLLQTFLDNWLEMTRVTIPIFILLLAVSARLRQEVSHVERP